MEVIDKVAPVKNKRIKRDSQWDNEILEKLIIREKLFKEYRKTTLHADKEIYKWSQLSRSSVSNFVFFKNKLPEFIGKPKDLWKAFKSLGLPSKSGGCIIGALAENKILKHYTQSILKTFKSLYSDLPWNILAKLLKLPNQYTINVSLIITKNFHYLRISNWTQQLKIIWLTYWKTSRSQKHPELTKLQENFKKMECDFGKMLCNLSHDIRKFF